METTSPISAALDAVMDRLIYECLATYGTADEHSFDRLLWLEGQLKADRDAARTAPMDMLNDVLRDITYSYVAGTITETERAELITQVHTAIDRHNEQQFSRNRHNPENLIDHAPPEGKH
jgi:hypothetical protein